MSAESAAPWVNASGLADEQVVGSVREVAAQLSDWVATTNGGRSRNAASLLNRAGYAEPGDFYTSVDVARRAVARDDIVSAVADVTEALAYQGISWEGDDADQADAFNQINVDLDLDSFVRAAHREMFTCSQVIVASWWARKTYTVRGYSPPKQTPLEESVDPITGMPKFAEPRDPLTHRPLKPRRGAKRRKTYDLYAPTRLTILDPRRVVPIAASLWGSERLAWQATKAEIEVWTGLGDLLSEDLTMATLIRGQYIPGAAEKASMEAMGIDTTALLELNGDRVWRHSAPKADYAPFPDIRLASVFSQLDLKAQLMAADRVNLVGAANYILLVKKGDKDSPAYPEEIDNLKDGFKVLAKLPVIVSDHRLDIEIITPATDSTLSSGKYDTIDRRIAARLLGAPFTAVESAGAVETTATSRMIARKLENERHQLKRFIEANIAKRVTDANEGVITAGAPSLAFTPRNVALDNDSQIVQAVMALRTQKEISRETVLEYFGFDQDVEMQRRIYEEESGADEIFGTKVPFDSPANGAPPVNAGGLPPGAFGPTGGRPTGGGTPPANATKPPAKKG